MSNASKTVYLSQFNKITDYIEFNKHDKVLNEYIDYIGFYWSYDHQRYLHSFKTLFNSDNWSSHNYWPFLVVKQWKFLFLYYSHLWHVVNIARFYELIIQNELVMKVDFYGKWILVVNRDNIWEYFVWYLKVLWFYNIRVTRVDYAVDCQKLNFRKSNKLKTKIKWLIRNDWEVEYYAFGRKWKSSHFIRYYNKKVELEKRKTLWLYPEYYFLPSVMRYELQVNGEWMDPHERNITINDLENLANFNIPISKRHRSSHQRKLFPLDDDIKQIKDLFYNISKSKNIEKFKEVEIMYKYYFNSFNDHL